MSVQTHTVNGVECFPIIDKCEGCERTREHEGIKFCTSYPIPERKWAQKVCNFATHVKAEIDKTGKVKVNPLKASKRAARGR
ncbi:PxxKW family cysteine-rich protein [Desulfovibrio inopinatus]|uniref:PxxKW family cysteine-rich protein n=1 Tax=Desulfovibrio inopinatus TaxID=102109 RepID=UPI0003FE4D4E|nr:PxxKW family cysteine-rich protein [Desulfovibrio inopinatus]